MQTHTNAAALFKALADDGTVPEPETLAPQWWLIWRYQLTPRYRSLQPDEYAASNVASSGGTFEAICAALCDWHAEEQVPLRAVGLLKSWIADELLVSVPPGTEPKATVGTRT
jgi:hypothetical protein